jgi:hypothetical protein
MILSKKSGKPELLPILPLEVHDFAPVVANKSY